MESTTLPFSFTSPEQRRNMKREIIITKDGSATVEIPALHVTYHSRHGAVQESMHVFIQAGLHYTVNKLHQRELRVFEMGFGTGLNALLTAKEAALLHTVIHYTSIERYPLSSDEIQQLNYTDQTDNIFPLLHQAEWNTVKKINEYFYLEKIEEALCDYNFEPQFHLIYYDAFAPNAQPELWSTSIFEKLYNMLIPQGVLVTYCSKGDVRRAMQAAGFSITKLQGPPGKREMLRAEK